MGGFFCSFLLIDNQVFFVESSLAFLSLPLSFLCVGGGDGKGNLTVGERGDGESGKFVICLSK